MNEPSKNFIDWSMDATWSLFLDRDGVLNEKLEGDYVRNVSQLKIIEGVPEAVASLSAGVAHTFIVTNQQGIGKGLMTESDLGYIHGYLLDILRGAGATIDGVYFAPQLVDEGSAMRKPNIGMAELARTEFPKVSFSKSVMVGDSISDMEFGRRAGMKTVFLLNDRHPADFPDERIDAMFPNLVAFEKALSSA